MNRLSPEGRLAAWLLLMLAAAGACGSFASQWLRSPWMGAGLVVLLSAVPVLWCARRLLRPLRNFVRSLTAAVTSYRDGDFGVSLPVQGHEELDELIRTHNELGQALREQRQQLAQRELLLDTVMQNSPVALLLLDSGQHVVYANLAARHILNDGYNLEGKSFTHLLGQFPPTLRQAFAAGGDSLFSVDTEGGEESYHLAQRSCLLRGRPHRLFLLKRMTRELSRQEVAVWKKLIRLLSHELNNSLAPISSVAHTGAEMVKRGNHARLGEVFERIAERAQHLQTFIDSYASFARLPATRPQYVVWEAFAQELTLQLPMKLQSQWPTRPGWFDPAQMSQALINLLKNALESGSPQDAIEFLVEETGNSVSITVRDRGSGMSSAVLANALLPFYSTKRSGTGLGLPLAREIVEAHGGNITLTNRDGGGSCVRIVLPQPTRAAVREPMAQIN